MMRRLLCLLFVAALAMSTLPSLTGAAPSAQDQACTTVGCTSGVAVALPKVAGATQATVCVNDTCRRFAHLGDRVQVVDAKLASAKAQVRVVLYDRHHRVRLRVVRSIALKRLTPNGEQCPPACWWRALRLDASHGGRLVPQD